LGPPARRGSFILSVALYLSAALVYVPWQYSRLRSTLPPIHDITTDTDNPPAFSAVLPARAAEHAGGVNYDDPKLPQQQKAAYPDLAALKAALPVAKAFNEALQVAPCGRRRGPYSNRRARCTNLAIRSPSIASSRTGWTWARKVSCFRKSIMSPL
jgi:hypothetical protein